MFIMFPGVDDHSKPYTNSPIKFYIDFKAIQYTVKLFANFINLYSTI